MPNWCDNHVEVTAPDVKTMQEFINFCSKPHTVLWTADEPTEETGVFWNFITPPDVNTYFGITHEEPKYEKSDDIMTNVINSLASDNDWYSWNVRNWGTKWDIEPDFDEIQDNGDSAYMNWNFQTAWSPALEAYSEMARKFPTMKFDFSYSELGMDYAGFISFENGKTVAEGHIDSPTHEQYLNELGYGYCERCGTDAQECSLCNECYEYKEDCECEKEDDLVSAGTLGEA
jgi:hypothetical protein